MSLVLSQVGYADDADDDDDGDKDDTGALEPCPVTGAQFMGTCPPRASQGLMMIMVKLMMIMMRELLLLSTQAPRSMKEQSNNLTV